MNKNLQNLAIFQKYKQYSKGVNRILYYWIKIYRFLYQFKKKYVSPALFIHRTILLIEQKWILKQKWNVENSISQILSEFLSPGASGEIWTIDLGIKSRAFYQGTLNGEVSLYCWPPVWLVWNQLYDNWQFWLFAKQINPNQSNRRSVVQWYCPL